MDIEPILSAIFFTVVYKPNNWLKTNTLQTFNYKYTFLMTNLLIIIIVFLGIELLLFFIIYKTPFISSWAWKFKVESFIDG